jgi:hypothetical protein
MCKYILLAFAHFANKHGESWPSYETLGEYAKRAWLKFSRSLCADNLSKSRLELGLRINRGFQRTNDLDCRRASRRRKTFRCAYR